ncbi:protein phosphatase [Kitasatospora sp. NBC_00240]|uniref:protein-tyrosine phosphatase family protein n=1 Tax=Kitasatospora sp. NBC_00240 TaxID=2903567 RepID=UPI0022564E8C|nr:protein phosphatase [Kitasatospora sp. NBC_00240]MCX5215134.1 protein phosphatase [Kitasatospora sp. NBC_00240]
MKTRQRERDAPEPQAPWNEITPGLWMGGHFWAGPGGRTRSAVADAEFDLVVSLFTRAGHGPHPRVEHLVGEIPDSPLTAEQIRTVQRLAMATAKAVHDDRAVLVRCHSGYNRSGLVVAQTLVELGQEPAAAVDLVRRRRSPWALNNRTFEQYLTIGLDIAALLTGLEGPV